MSQLKTIDSELAGLYEDILSNYKRQDDYLIKIREKYGGLAERSIASVLKTEDVERHPGVRIPKPPLKSWDTNPRFFFGRLPKSVKGAVC